MPAPHRSASPDDGFTLIEVVISLGLFALVGLAGLSLLNTVLGTQRRTERRLEDLGEIQRAVTIVTQDLQQMTGDPRIEDRNVLALMRPGPDLAPLSVRYRLAGARFERVIDSAGAGARVQPLLSNAAQLDWQYYDGRSWRADWPLADDPNARRPRAIAMNLTLAGPSAAKPLVLRRVVVLSAAP